MPGISAWEIAAVVYSFYLVLHNKLWDLPRNEVLEASYEIGYAELNPIFIFKVS